MTSSYLESSAALRRAIAALALLGAGCNGDPLDTDPARTRRDLVLTFESPDLGEPDLALGPPNGCGDNDPGCVTVSFGPPFPLETDPMPDPRERDQSVQRTPGGTIALDNQRPSFNYLWLANPTNFSGTISRVDAKTVREVARYQSVTCMSNRSGSTSQCDGTSGCCSLDDWLRYSARQDKMPEPGHQAVQRTSNHPSRTAVDFNGDLFVANRAFGGQSSVTKIAADKAACIDRNHNGRVDTSSDTNGNGFIETDCNGDGMPDDIAQVQGTPCTNGLAQEFYGDDDECILWTTNTFTPRATGRPLALAGGSGGSISDAWAGSYQLGKFLRIDGTTGRCKADIQLPAACNGGTGPYGLVVDSSGIGWSTPLSGGKLCYFDTNQPSNAKTGFVRDPQWGQAQGYGITTDRDQNIWLGSTVARYTPNRSKGFAGLNEGFWLRAGGLNGIGIAADSRNAKDYFVYSCSDGRVTQIPASTLPNMKMDLTVNNPGWPTIQMPCYGVGVDADQNVWGIDMSKSTRARVDGAGKITQPNPNGAPQGNNLCPAGDSCPNAGAYTYSDFTGFGLKTLSKLTGSYTMVVPGCRDAGGQPVDTIWHTITWDADVPASTSLTVSAKAGSAAAADDPAWDRAMYTVGGATSPYLLQGALDPNLAPGAPKGTMVNDQYLLVEFFLRAANGLTSPQLKSFSVSFRCP